MPNEILAFRKWKSNAHLIKDVASLGYLHQDWLTLDCTWGRGGFWTQWAPNRLIGMDKEGGPSGYANFLQLPFRKHTFDAVVFDPPYKLSGRPRLGEFDDRYGIQDMTPWKARMVTMLEGVRECARVLGDGYLLVKCQDQVCSGKVRWQSFEVMEAARSRGLGLVDRFDMESYRRQPPGRSQVHARRNTSSLLVFKREW